MTLAPSRQTSLKKLLVFALVLAAACASAIGKAPPNEEPVFTRIVVVPGAPIVTAAKAARTLQDNGYATRRFRSDSTWASRASDNMNARLRYTSPSADSTRILVEMWGKCERGGRNCFVGELVRLVAALTTEEAPPQ